MPNTLVEILTQDALMAYEAENNMKYEDIRIVPLGIRSKKAIVLLNAALINKYDARPQRTGRWNRCGQKGGGLLCMTEAHYAIDDMNQIYVVFGNRGRVTDYCRAATTMVEITKSIKDKIANSLKEWFNGVEKVKVHSLVQKARRSDDYRMYSGDYKSVDILPQSEGVNIQHTTNNQTNFEIIVSKDEYRCLYETLKGRDEEKIRTKYGKDIYEQIVGSKIEDQFVISALEIIKNEINNAINEKKARLSEIDKEYSERYQALMDEKKARIQIVTDESTHKVNELNKQLAEMMANAVVI